ncbi:MAG: hypothetical protein ACYTG0_05945, partial [Planctomycetota bacterium]
MKAAMWSVVSAAGVVLLGSAASAQDFAQMEAEKAQRAAKLLVEKAAEVKSPQVAVKADVAKAIGLRFRQDGILVVPQKGLKEDADATDVKAEQGAPLGYLFMSTSFRPVAGGKQVLPEKLRTFKVVDRNGNERT